MGVSPKRRYYFLKSSLRNLLIAEKWLVKAGRTKVARKIEEIVNEIWLEMNALEKELGMKETKLVGIKRKLLETWHAAGEISKKEKEKLERVML
ncbi:MAG TPA: hypothetical protein ENF82_04875 [Candidatus Methanomethylia archaeon]|nr:hypothetical protein [Candidatus Methanomethylicia archaeon]